MIWEHFPVGMNFSVADFSEETKRSCWKLALSALNAVAPEQYEEMKLYDCCSENMPGSGEKNYICILDHRHVKQSRVTLAAWKRMPELLAHLSLHFPFYQANALDPFSPYPLLAEVLTDGTLNRSESGKAVLPERLLSSLPQCEERTVLVAGPAKPDALGWANELKKAGLIAAKQNENVDYLPYSNGGIGTVYALTYGKHGRFEWLETKNTAAESMRLLFGVIPGYTAVFDCAALLQSEKAVLAPSYALGSVIRTLLDYGYRRFLLPMEGFLDSDDGTGLLEALLAAQDSTELDPRVKESVFTVITADGLLQKDGTIGKLLELGATVQSAAECMDAHCKFDERCKNADELVILAKEEDRIALRLKEAAGGKPVQMISAQ